jgi:preprotein translocase subunit SecA
VPQLTEDDYEIDEKQRTATFSETGTEQLEKMLAKPACSRAARASTTPRTFIVHHVNQALRAHKLFQRDKDYIVATARSSSSTSSPAA